MLEFIPLHHVILPNALLCSYELNTLDACWIVVDEWSNSSRCRIISIYLFWTWCLYTWSSPRYTHNYAQFCQLLNSNLFTHRRILMLSWETPLMKPMAPGSIFYHISFSSIFYLHLLLSNLYHKNTKNIYLILLSLSDLTFASYHKWIDNPFIALVARFLLVCVGAWDFWGAS